MLNLSKVSHTARHIPQPVKALEFTQPRDGVKGSALFRKDSQIRCLKRICRVHKDLRPIDQHRRHTWTKSIRRTKFFAEIISDGGVYTLSYRRSDVVELLVMVVQPAYVFAHSLAGPPQLREKFSLAFLGVTIKGQVTPLTRHAHTKAKRLRGKPVLCQISSC